VPSTSVHSAAPAEPTDLAAEHRSLPSLTGLRWVAAFVVFGVHVRLLHYFDDDVQSLMTRPFSAGASGVSLFFILSGFVLTWAERPGLAPTTFWRRRFARVYPLHLVTLVLALALGATLLPRESSEDPLGLLANLALVHSWWPEWMQTGNTVSWSLACEAFFYLLFPLVIPAVRRLPARSLWATGALLAVVIVVLPLASPWFPSTIDYYSWPLTRLPEFLAGIVVGRLVRTGSWRGPGVAVSALLAVVGYGVATRVGEPLSVAACTVIGFACLIAALARADVAGRRTPLSGAWSVKLGEVSFAFYLVHLLVLQVIGSRWDGWTPELPLVPAAALAVAAGAVGLALAWLLHEAVERPAQRLLTGAGRRSRPSRRS
jgi:peptidoglycan/LPS O-acetylase OafA/YrhL